MKRSVIPSGARDPAIAMTDSSSDVTIDEGKTLRHFPDVFAAGVGSLIVFATRDDTVFI
jgi:hypothetical protein